MITDFESVGKWRKDETVELFKIGDDVFALDGWNGVKFSDSLKCTGKFYMDVSEESYSVIPIHHEINEEDSVLVAFEVHKN